MSEDKKNKILKEIPDEALAQVSGGIYEAKYIMPEGSADINQQSGGDHESGYEVKWKAEDQIRILRTLRSGFIVLKLLLFSIEI